MEPDDLDLHFYPVVALPDAERDEWHRIILSAIAETSGTLTVVFVQDRSGWVLEGFLWAAPAGGVISLPRERYRPLRGRVVSALTSAGKPVRTP